jgi:hypothetical protein
MTRLLDLGIDHIRNIIMDMAKLSENSVFTAIESNEKGIDVKRQIFEWSEILRVLQEEVGRSGNRIDSTLSACCWERTRSAKLEFAKS